MCSVPGFWENVLDSFSCFYIEFAYSNFSSSDAYMLNFLAHHAISVRRAYPWAKSVVKPAEFISSNKARIMKNLDNPR